MKKPFEHIQLKVLIILYTFSLKSTVTLRLQIITACYNFCAERSISNCLLSISRFNSLPPTIDKEPINKAFFTFYGKYYIRHHYCSNKNKTQNIKPTQFSSSLYPENIISHIEPKSNKAFFNSKRQKTKKRPKNDRLKFVLCSHPKNRTKEEQGEERKVIGQALGLLVLPGTHITALTPAAYQPGSLPGTLLAYAMGNLILRLASRLDAFSVYPIRT